VMRLLPQARENVRVRTKDIPRALRREFERLDADARILVRPSGTEPVVRVLAEAETLANAQELCARIASLVRRELG
jgi:phosphoglucosamine mutase